MIPGNVSVQCPYCGKVRTLSQWDDESRKMANKVKASSKYKSLSEDKLWTEDSDYFYYCNYCKFWHNSRTLKIINNPKYANYGGESAYRYVKKKSNIEGNP